MAGERNWEGRENPDRAQFIGLGASPPTEAWLISPAVDLQEVTDPFLTFESIKSGVGPDLEVLVSTNYSGEGNPGAAAWDVLQAPLSEGNEAQRESGEVPLALPPGSPPENVHIAFRYHASGAEGAVWQILEPAVKGTYPALQLKLTFSLGPGAPAGAVIDAVTGTFHWMPSESDGGKTYPITVTVTDDGDPPMSASEVIQVTVRETNDPPLFKSPEFRLTATEDLPLSEQLSLMDGELSVMDADIPKQPLLFSLQGDVPSEATITDSGELEWEPSELDGGQVFTFAVRVTDVPGGDLMAMSDTATVIITVIEDNKPPVIDCPEPQVTDEEIPFEVQVTASDPDLPAGIPENTLTFILGESAPTGVAITEAGLLTWTPTETQGPGDYNIPLVVEDVPGASDSCFLLVRVNEVNRPPIVHPFPMNRVQPGERLECRAVAEDPDLPSNTLTFSLGSLPVGAEDAEITPDGRFAWTPDPEVMGEFVFEVVATDDGVPSMSDSETFKVVVFREAHRVRIERTPGGLIQITVDRGAAGDRYRFRSSLDLQTWRILENRVDAEGAGVFYIDPVGPEDSGEQAFFYRVEINPEP